VAIVLRAENQRAICVPERFAHGYQLFENANETSNDVGA